MIHPVVCNPVLSPLVGILNSSRWRAGRNAPLDSILHWDADIDAFSEQTGGAHTFNHAVLSPQYQLNADGSYANVGAKPAVDVFGGKKWLRSCGAVQNLLPSGSENFASGWTAGFVSVSAASGWYKIEETADSQSHSVTSQNITPVAGSSYTARVHLKAAERGFAFVGFVGAATIFVSVNLSTGVVSVATGSPVSYSAEAADGGWVVYITVVLPTTTVTKLDVRTSFDGVWANRSYIGVLGSGILVRSPILTATPYPVPYVPPGVTQPASNATTTNGSWFSLPDGSELWKALTGQPLTLATRVRMGVGSGDIVGADVNLGILAELADGFTPGLGVLYAAKKPTDLFRIVRSYDGTTALSPTSSVPWSRGAILRLVTQVNTAGTQFRVGYLIEGTHTDIQWTSWSAFDGAFRPSTLYCFMLGFSNAYPMWFNKITAWKKQCTDAEILEAMA